VILGGVGEGLVIRGVEPGELPAFLRAIEIPFLNMEEENPPELWYAIAEADRCVGVVDDGRFVGNAAAWTRDLTIPSGADAGDGRKVLPMAAVTAVGVHPSHRRRGLLTQMMARLLDQARERNEPLAGLIAAETIIYGRFGYGLATSFNRTSLRTRRSAFLPSLASGPSGSGRSAGAGGAGGGRVRLVDTDEAKGVLPELFDECRRRRSGEISRTPASWAASFADAKSKRGGGGPIFYAVSDDGYAAYRAFEVHTDDAIEGHRLIVRSLYARTPEAEIDLWRFILDVDLVGEVVAEMRPVDDPLRWRLADSRHLKVQWQGDFLWVRILDVPVALGSRAYREEGTLVFEIVPGEAAVGTDDIAGRWRLEGGPDGASCRRAPGEDVDVTLDASSLGAVYLGGVAPSTLARAGRVVEERPGALGRADRLFSTAIAPFCGTGF
jgi:predicted acetyltransferase